MEDTTGSESHAYKTLMGVLQGFLVMMPFTLSIQYIIME